MIATARRYELLQDLQSKYATITPVVCDVTDFSQVEKLFQSITHLDAAILNAGMSRHIGGHEFDAAASTEIINTNIGGIIHFLHFLIPLFKKQQSGRLALVGSVAGYRGLPYSAVYCASKAAVMSLAETLRCDLSQDNIHVHLISPGFVDTAMTKKNKHPMPMMIPASVAAEHIYKGLQKDRFEIVFPRPFIWLLKLVRYLPNFIYFPVMKYLGKRVATSF